jgi:hypothetical protein
LKGARHRLNQVGTKESIAKLEEAIRRKEKEISSMSPDGIGSREKYQILAAFAERMQIIEKLSASVESVEVREKNIVFAESRSRLFHQTYNANRFDVSISNKVRKEKVQQLRRQDSLSRVIFPLVREKVERPRKEKKVTRSLGLTILQFTL